MVGCRGQTGRHYDSGAESTIDDGVVIHITSKGKVQTIKGNTVNKMTASYSDTVTDEIIIKLLIITFYSELKKYTHKQEDMKVSMSAFTETPLIIGVVVSVLGIIFAFSTLKPNKNEITTLRDWSSREKWDGKIIEASIETWHQTDTKYGNDFLYDFSFTAPINNINKKYVAKGLVRPNEIHKIQKGLTLIIKYNNDNPPRIAVVAIDYK